MNVPTTPRGKIGIEKWLPKQRASPKLSIGAKKSLMELLLTKLWRSILTGKLNHSVSFISNWISVSCHTDLFTIGVVEYWRVY